MLEELRANVKNSEEYKTREIKIEAEITRIKNEIYELSKKGISEVTLIFAKENIGDIGREHIRIKYDYFNRIIENLRKNELEILEVQNNCYIREFKISWY